MLKKSLSAILMSCAALGSMTVHAADEQRYAIDLTATIPTDNFQVIPVEGGWVNQTQEMVYDLGTKKLQDFSKQFQYKNTSGGIQATLTNTDSTGTAILSNGTDTIPLTVIFNGVSLSNKANTVVNAADAKAGGRTSLRITQKTDQPLTVTGSFTGQVAMVFEPVLVEPPTGDK
ncbi:CS1 type fimbrial major subunit [Providencia stuartii]|uniref:Adhesin n=1 Tax=Providencia stuartii (strain MRSN 2154) TaxID=1157951 RepID=A0A140NPF4_PROSM|nr:MULTISPECIES: CS1 type fimbrial major subunit [Providencia]AFH94520.1 adhesin [Providencia stuartii MRSN 2154]MDE8745851.1 CS1 type fimbrial major subunit [Providencia thailandensis]MDE8767261.1 CS1 type fimbrial major subunit [Providencia thailandensis]MDE8779632.1 CS1 type fimbrial major subunit [Providencia thailandensis]MDE8783696.1 CS1 type fimbrial major subunit [Providencia thailandensis]